MRALVLIALAACGTSDDGLRIAGATPGFGPLVGGSQITLTGTGFTAGVRALIAGREAPLVTATSDAALAIVIPPGEHPGDAEIVVFDGTHSAHATGVFHYSTLPTVTAVTPADALYSTSQVATVTGSGFLDEAAGDITVVVGNQQAFDVHARSDTELTFSTPLGTPLARPTIQVTNARGTATLARAFRYVPSQHSGLVMFSEFGGEFGIFFDPSNGEVVPIPLVPAPSTWLMGIARDTHNDYWGLDTSWRFGRVDMTTQTIEAPIGLQRWLPALTRLGDDFVAIDGSARRFGRLDPASGYFVSLGDPILCCGSYGLASDGTTLWFTTRDQTTAQVMIASIDPATGAAGTAVPIVGAGAGFNVDAMRFYNGTLYVTSSDGTLLTVDPTTGAATVLPVNLGRFSAMEVFE